MNVLRDQCFTCVLLAAPPPDKPRLRFPFIPVLFDWSQLCLFSCSFVAFLADFGSILDPSNPFWMLLVNLCWYLILKLQLNVIRDWQNYTVLSRRVCLWFKRVWFQEEYFSVWIVLVPLTVPQNETACRAHFRTDVLRGIHHHSDIRDISPCMLLPWQPFWHIFIYGPKRQWKAAPGLFIVNVNIR